MKKIVSIVSTALVVLAAVSCSKEQGVVISEKTFTASLGASKVSVAADGKTNWTVGDVIVVYNGNNTASSSFSSGECSSENIQVVKVTDGMITSGGSSVSFSVNIPSPAGDSWYAFATNNAANIQEVKADGTAVVSLPTAIVKDDVPFFACCKVAKASSKLAFHHGLGLLKMTCSKAATKVVVSSNGTGDMFTKANVTPCSDGTVSVSEPTASTTAIEADVTGLGSDDAVYVALLGNTYQNGLSIKAYNGDDLVGQANITKSLTISAGVILNLGDFIAKGESGGSSEVNSWKWSLDWASREANFDGTKYVVNEDKKNGEIRFVHTNATADYLIGAVTEDQIAQTTYCFGQDASKQGYGYYGGLKNDYWSIKCNGALPAGTKINVKFLVWGDNQAMAFWNGAYSIDGAEAIYLEKSDMVYDWGKSASKASTWTVTCNCRYVLAYGPKGNAAGSWAHLIDETITLPSAVTSCFEFRLIVADNVFHKASVSMPGTVRSDPLHSLAIVANGTRGTAAVTQPAVEVTVVK